MAAQGVIQTFNPTPVKNAANNVTLRSTFLTGPSCGRSLWRPHRRVFPWPSSAAFRPKSDQPLLGCFFQLFAIDAFGIGIPFGFQEGGSEPVLRGEGKGLRFIVNDVVVESSGSFERGDGLIEIAV